MRKVRFVSNLIYALRQLLGWCPTPPKTGALRDGNVSVIVEDKVDASPWLRAGLSFFSIFTFILLWLIVQNWTLWVVVVKIVLTFAMISAAFTFWSLRIWLTDHLIEVKYGYRRGTIRYSDIEQVEIKEVHPILTGLGLGLRWIIEEGGYGYLARGGSALVLTLKKRHRGFNKFWISTRKPQELFNALSDHIQSQPNSSIDGVVK